MATVSHDATNISVKATMKIPKTRLNDKPRRNKHKHRNNGENTDDTTVNAGFSGSKSGQRKKPYKRNNPGASSLDRILDRSCQIHGTPDKPANHTNRSCWVFKQAGKINAENKEKGSQSEDDDDDATSISIETMVKILMTRRSTPDSVAPSPVSGRSHIKGTIRAHPVWIAYLTAHVKSTAPPINQPITPTGVAGFLNKPAR